MCVSDCVKEKKTERVEEEILSYVSDIFYTQRSTSDDYLSPRYLRTRLYSYANVYSLFAVLFLR